MSKLTKKVIRDFFAHKKHIGLSNKDAVLAVRSSDGPWATDRFKITLEKEGE